MPIAVISDDEDLKLYFIESIGFENIIFFKNLSEACRDKNRGKHPIVIMIFDKNKEDLKDILRLSHHKNLSFYLICFYKGFSWSQIQKQYFEALKNRNNVQIILIEKKYTHHMNDFFKELEDKGIIRKKNKATYYMNKFMCKNYSCKAGALSLRISRNTIKTCRYNISLKLHEDYEI